MPILVSHRDACRLVFLMRASRRFSVGVDSSERRLCSLVITPVCSGFERRHKIRYNLNYSPSVERSYTSSVIFHGLRGHCIGN